jgi:large subunit ribosomal protein L25
MKKHLLTVTVRNLTGKKVKKLRKEGMLPANIYGKGIKSVAVQLPLKTFEITYHEAGETGIIDLNLDGEKRPVLIHNVQRDFISYTPIHVDFFQVNLKEKVKTMVPIVLVGEAKAVSDKVGLLLHTLNQVEVEALPTDLPEHIEGDVSNLAVINDQLTVLHLKKPAGVTILTDPEQVVAKISELISKETEKQIAAEKLASEEAKAEGETTIKAEGETAVVETEDKTPETK